MEIETEKKKQEETILYFARKCKKLKEKLKSLQDEEKRFKEELRGIMKEYNIKKLEGEGVEIEIRYGYSFDVGVLLMEYPWLYEKYVHKEKKIIETEEIMVNEKDLKRFYPVEYKNCLAELTPRLYIK